MNAEPSMAAPDLDPQQVRPRRLLLTPDEYLVHERELERLRAMRGRDLPARLREARTFVSADAVEEIAQIYVDQTVMDVRILTIEDLLSTATILEGEHGVDVVALGSVVEVAYASTGRRATYVLTGTGAHTDLMAASARSPVGQALLGRREGEVVVAHLPGGRVEHLEILRVTQPPGHSG